MMNIKRFQNTVVKYIRIPGTTREKRRTFLHAYAHGKPRAPRTRKKEGEKKEPRNPQTGGGNGEASQGAESTERGTKNRKRERSRSGHLSARRSQIRPPEAARRLCDGWLAAPSLGRLHGSRPSMETVEGKRLFGGVLVWKGGRGGAGG